MEFRSAKLKIDRAREQIREIESFVEDNPPYSYCLETNITTSQRATFAKKNDNALDTVVIRCGEVLHNLRSAIDHAYWDAVSPCIEDASKHGAIQFPFAKDGSKLESAIKSRLAHKVSNNFYLAIESIKPFAGEGGNKIFNLVHEINIVDKHKFPTPVGDFTRISSSKISSQIPDFPKGIIDGGFGQNGRDVVWTGRIFDTSSLGKIVPPTMDLFHKKLDVSVGLMFSIKEPQFHAPVIDTLYNMADELQRIIDVMQVAVNET